MKIIVYGLGIIGASLCAALKRAGHTVYGRNRSREPIEYALAHGMIDGATDSCEGADVVFLALPPRIIILPQPSPLPTAAALSLSYMDRELLSTSFAVFFTGIFLFHNLPQKFFISLQ